MKPIYEPKGAAKEYGDLALNIYTGCPHKCWYCYVPNVLRMDRKKFHTDIRPRPNIVEETRKQLEREQITGKLIHLCFTCDPYPTGYDSSVTREIIKLLKEYGNHIQILTKGDGRRDFDLLDSNDWYGITVDGQEPIKGYADRVHSVMAASEEGIRTWISYEPVTNVDKALISLVRLSEYVDVVKIGKLNHIKSDTDWKTFGQKAEEICKRLNLEYYIKDSLRKEMEKE